MMEALRWIGSYLIGIGGIGLAVTIAAVAVAVLLPTVRQIAIVVAVAAAASTASYTWGRADERSFTKAKLQREIGNAILKGDNARERALRDFDAADGVPDDDGFRRP